MRFILIFFTVFVLNSCHFYRSVMKNVPDLDDYKYFPNKTIETAEKPFYFKEAIDQSLGEKIRVTPTAGNDYNYEQTLNEYFLNSQTVAMLFIRNDSIIYERYDKGYERESLVTTFSLVKSFISLLVGIAIEEGYIGSVNDPIAKYIPELAKKKNFNQITIEHLLTMKSGIKQAKNPALPFSQQLKFYYGKNLNGYIKKLKVKYEPGTFYRYAHVSSTQLLGMVLEHATEKSIDEYLQEKIWSKIGTESDGLWSLDKKNGTIKAFCCFNAKAHDFAKFGRLVLNRGNWDGQQIVPEAWVDKILDVDTTDNRWLKFSKMNDRDYQRYHWWMGTKGHGDYKASGLFGQYVHLFPKENIIMITFSDRKGIKEGYYEVDMYYQILEQIKEVKINSDS